MFRPKTPIVPSSTTANALATTTTSVNVSNAAAPKTGQILRATGGSAATWQNPFAMWNDFTNPQQDYSAAWTDVSTTLAAQATAGNNYIDVVDYDVATTYSVGHGIAIPGAGTAGVELLTSILSRSASRLYLNATIQTTVAAGGLVYHDDTVALRNCINDDTSVKRIWLPIGRPMLTGRIDFTKRRKIVIGSDWANEFFYNTSEYFPDSIGTILIPRFNNTDVFYFGSSFCALKGMSVMQHPSVTRTAGRFAQLGPSTGTISSPDATYPVYEGSGTHATFGDFIEGPSLSNIATGNMWDGIRHGYTFDANVSNIKNVYFKSNSFILDMPIPFGGSNFANLKSWGGIDGSGTMLSTVNAAQLIKQADLNTWTSINSWGTKHGWDFDVATGKTAFGQIVGGANYCDNVLGGYGVRMQRAGTGVCHGNKIVGMGINTSGALGTFIIGAGCVYNTFVAVSGHQIAKSYTNNGGATNQIIACESGPN